MTHIPVLLREVLSVIAPRNDELYLDGTFGRGGYSEALLKAAECRVLGVDRDPAAIEHGQMLVKTYGGRLTLVRGRFSQMDQIARDQAIEQVDAVALDIGVSSPQIDDADRGFSFRNDGPLDMRMGNDGETAADIVNSKSEEEIADILYTYGEEKKSRYIARAIVEARVEIPFTRTQQLADLVRSVVYKSKKDQSDPATRTFQALRIYVNEELSELRQGLEAAEKILRPGGRLAIVTFHSLEDRIVKEFFRVKCGYGVTLSRHAPPANSNVKPSFSMLHKKTITAQDDEIRANPRARSAKLRAAIKVDNT